MSAAFEHIQQLTEHESPMTAWIAQDLIDNWETPKEIIRHLQDVTNYGCASGSCNGLVYHWDTKEFFVKFSQDIDYIVEEMQENGILPEVQFPLTNHYSWLAYEHVCYEILCEMEELYIEGEEEDEDDDYDEYGHTDEDPTEKEN